MISIPEELMDVLVSTPDTLGGSVRFAGTRIPVQALIDSVEAGDGLDDVLKGWPDVEREQALAVLTFHMNEVRQRYGLGIN